LIKFLNDFLLEIYEKEQEIEEKKQVLAKREDFNIFEIFKMCFDLKGTGFIDMDCLERVYDDFDIIYSSS